LALLGAASTARPPPPPEEAPPLPPPQLEDGLDVALPAGRLVRQQSADEFSSPRLSRDTLSPVPNTSERISERQTRRGEADEWSAPSLASLRPPGTEPGGLPAWSAPPGAPIIVCHLSSPASPYAIIIIIIIIIISTIIIIIIIIFIIVVVVVTIMY
jgi:hypothetical protein